MTEAELEDAVLAAHAAGDLPRLIACYLNAADMAERDCDVERACFFLTQAWIFALDAGDDRAVDLKARLVAHRRDIDG